MRHTSSWPQCSTISLMEKPNRTRGRPSFSLRLILAMPLLIIWDEVRESKIERDRMLLELEQECLEVYRRKVHQANKRRAHIRHAIADSGAELAAICSAMGERPVHIRQSDQNTGSLKEELFRS